jgi:hypothetical protein
VTVVDAVHLDVEPHTIPENRSKADPAHADFNFRYIFHTCSPKPAPRLEEVTEARWFPIMIMPCGRPRSGVEASVDRSAHPTPR